MLERFEFGRNIAAKITVHQHETFKMIRHSYFTITSTFLFSALVLMFLMQSCRHQNPKDEQSDAEQDDASSVEQLDQPSWIKKPDSAFLTWQRFYQEHDSNFRSSRFTAKDSLRISPIQGTVKTIHDRDFDPVYANFLVYAPDSSRYIDMDSYLWSLGKEDNIDFSVDQEINLVDLKTDSVTRIAFFGPSYRVEEVVWLDNQRVLLLGIGDGNQPFVQQIDLNALSGRVYTYPDSIDIQDPYLEQRIQSRLKE